MSEISPGFELRPRTEAEEAPDASQPRQRWAVPHEFQPEATLFGRVQHSLSHTELLHPASEFAAMLQASAFNPQIAADDGSRGPGQRCQSADVIPEFL